MKHRKIRVGIVGCGAIGSRIALSTKKELAHVCELTGLYDIDNKKVAALAKKFRSKRIIKRSLTDLIKSCDCMVEAVNAKETHTIIKQALRAKRSVLAMSVGKLLKFPKLFEFAKHNRCTILIPSGAIAGIDAIKAASLAGIKKITITTRKPLKGFKDNPYLLQKRFKLSKIKKETRVFQGKVSEAVKHFPQNINVAATIALASGSIDKLIVRIMTSPHYTHNSHEIEAEGNFGKLFTRTENVLCPDNPKTSYLAVLSGIQTLKEFCSGVHIGT